MQTVEITGKSLQEATKAAATKLGVPAESLNVTVLEETKGLFGKSNVRIRAEVVSSNGGAPAAAKPARGAAKTSTARAGKAVAAVPEPPMEAITEAFEEKPAEKPKRGRGGRAPKAETAAAPVAEQASAVAPSMVEDSRESEGDGPAATEADADRLLSLVRELLDSADLEVSAKTTKVSGRYVNIELDGKDVAYLVGKHGEVLNALQYLINIIAGRRFDNGIRATIDGNNYRNRREQQLNQHATRVADEVKKRGEEAVLDALPAFERRIVHKALSEYAGVTTYSEGEEPNRRVVIAPAD
jgi:spoIIIJ-associated protein